MQALALGEAPKPHSSFYLFSVQGITTPEAAKRYRGKPFYYPAEALPPAEDDFYWFEAVGAEVWDDAGEYWGTLARLEGSDQYTCMVIRSAEGRDILYPAQADLIHFDREHKRLTVQAIEGLRDL